jgi:hypothetical protein
MNWTFKGPETVEEPLPKGSGSFVFWITQLQCGIIPVTPH